MLTDRQKVLIKAHDLGLRDIDLGILMNVSRERARKERVQAQRQYLKDQRNKEIEKCID